MIWLLLIACPKQAPESSAGDVQTTTVSGVVFEFQTRTPLPGVQVDLDLGEQGLLHAESDAEGRWTAAVPDGVPFTPVLAVDGYLPARHATFVVGPGTEALPGYLDKPERLDLQAVPMAVFQDMADALAGTPLQREACLIVDTVTVAQVYSMASFADFVILRPHGEPGVQMRLEPDPGVDPIYFNESVLPDYSLSLTSQDGGVVWLNVPPGVYTVTGEHPDPSLEIVPREVTCLEGQLINLNPPMGAGVRLRE